MAEAEEQALRTEGWPGVSVVMPVLNERDHLEEAVERVLAQRYPGPLEIVLAVGPSHDGSRAIADRLGATHEAVHVVDNPTGRTPAGLNAAIRKSVHPVVLRVDGHGLLPPGYVHTAVEVLLETGADNVGGVMAPEGTTSFERAVAWAMSSRWGIGGARFHLGGEEGEVETVYLGTFRREVLERLGGFDEAFTRAQDWELNHRIRKAGGRVWFSPLLQVTYRPRSNVRALTRQFFTTGAWRMQVMRRYPETVSARYLAPPATVVVLVVGCVAGSAGLLFGIPGVAVVGFLAPLGYLAVVAAATCVASRRLDPAATMRLPAVLVTMHLSWGAGFLRALIEPTPAQIPPRVDEPEVAT